MKQVSGPDLIVMQSIAVGTLMREAVSKMEDEGLLRLGHRQDEIVSETVAEAVLIGMRVASNLRKQGLGWDKVNMSQEEWDEAFASVKEHMP